MALAANQAAASAKKSINLSGFAKRRYPAVNPLFGR